ncbi:uncharacterized protein PFLUO_LOCUS5249 [Penicillium psychrofluorescens]|uniref:uncharacterized protein n=1 Tax=Penicillium psychrofluorescens TaxID=3158075 RepID=UPI003CCDFCDB
MTATSWTDAAATPSQPAGSGLFTSGATVSIDAPASVVFDIITSYSRYSEWNTWTPTLAFEDADGNVAAGAEGRLKTIMKAQNRAYDIPIEILELDRTSETHKLAWRSKLLPGWAATAERVQTVTPVSGNDGACEVKTWETMSGPAAYVFKYLMGVPKQLNESNVNYLAELKTYAEGKQAGQA